MVDALRTRRIKGAGLESHYYYPLPCDHPLWGMENLILTPHISGSVGSPHFAERIGDVFVEDVRCFLGGSHY